MKILIYTLMFLLIIACDNSLKPEVTQNTFQFNQEISSLRDSVAHLNQMIADSKQAEVIPKKEEIKEPELDLKCIECLPEDFYAKDFYVNNYVHFGTFVDSCLVYDSQDSLANVIDVLPIMTRLNILGEFENHFLVCTPKSQAGFVLKSNVYTHQFYALRRDRYLSGIIDYNLKSRNYWNHGALQILRVNKLGETLDCYVDSFIKKKYNIKRLYSTALKNVKAIFHISFHYFSGAGVEENKFIIDNGKIQQLISIHSIGDGGWAERETVYLPTKMNSGKVVLVSNGEFKADWATGKTKTFTYPADIGIPIEELIVVQKIESEMVEDEDGKSSYDKDGDYAKEIWSKETKYYRWDGEKLNLEKTVKEK